MDKPTAKLNGVLLIDKDIEQTSFTVVKKVRHLFNVRKVGHTGTLDPIATGVLPVCLGKATKLSNLIMRYTKEYDVWARFGTATDSHDRTGNIIDEKPWEHIDEASIRQALPEFVGEITQVPPMFSAIKYKGRPLYWYAHKGIHFANRQERQVTVHSFELIEFKPPKARFLIRSSQGTYVRTLVHDLGEKLGSVAVVDDLRRTACGPFRAENTFKMADLLTMEESERLQKILPMREALPDLPEFRVSTALSRRILTGRTVMWSDLVPAGQEAAVEGLFKVTGPKGDLVAVASLRDRHHMRQDGSSGFPINRIVRTHQVFGA